MGETVVLDRENLQRLFEALQARGYQVLGPRLEQEAIVYGPLQTAGDLPVGWVDEQSGGHYRLSRAPEHTPESKTLFSYVVGPQSWKRYLFPPEQSLWRARREDDGFSVQVSDIEPRPYAFFGVRACELAAIEVQDRVFDNGQFTDMAYQLRREQVLLVAVNCTRPGGTCFCASTGTGPEARAGYDLSLTELLDREGHRFLLQAGSETGRSLLADLDCPPASGGELAAARDLLARAADHMGRELLPEAAAVVGRNPEHPRWLHTAERCLSCGNCTMVCPTCFCSTVEDITSLDGREAERVRRWDSCFGLEQSYIHGGSIRRGGAARYRQWITHKLSTWHEQFDVGGCTGCGRCITWCPVGIDITEEVAAIRASEEEGQ